MNKFEAGKTYFTRSACDHEAIIRVSVASRTEKTITDTSGQRFRINSQWGEETVKPWGSYSMAPIVSANRPVKD